MWRKLTMIARDLFFEGTGEITISMCLHSIIIIIIIIIFIIITIIIIIIIIIIFIIIIIIIFINIFIMTDETCPEQ